MNRINKPNPNICDELVHMGLIGLTQNFEFPYVYLIRVYIFELGGSEIRPEGGEDEGNSRDSKGVREHVERVRGFYNGSNEEELSRRRSSNDWRRARMGSFVWVWPGTYSRDSSAT